jgi:hypothetical protein
MAGGDGHACFSPDAGRGSPARQLSALACEVEQLRQTSDDFGQWRYR